MRLHQREHKTAFGRAGAWVAAVIAASASVVAAQELPSVRIAVLSDGSWAQVEALEAQVREELLTLTRGEFEVEFPPARRIDANWQVDAVSRGFEDLLAAEDVDLVLTMGLIGSQLALARDEGYARPVVAPMVVDASIRRPGEGGGSGVRNLNYVALPQTLRSELDEYSRLVPMRRVAVLVNEGLSTALPQLGDLLSRELVGASYQVEYLSIPRTAAGALAAIPEDTDAVYLFPLAMSERETEALLAGLIDRGLPAFSSIGREQVERGALATLRQSATTQLARRIALNIQRIALGEAPDDIAVGLSMRSRLVVNVETARRTGVHLPWEVYLEADLVGENPDNLLPLSLETAVQAAIRANRDLGAARVGLQADALDIDIARSALKPQLGASLLTTQIDSSRAELAMGSSPERATSAGVALDQLVYSEPALANLRVQKLLQQSREQALIRQELDIAVEASTAYLNLLRAKNLLNVSRNNLSLTRTNAELAASRREVGTAAAGEIYRWQSQVAADRQALVDAQANVQAAEVSLNRLLNLDLEERHRTEDLDLEDESLVADQDEFDRLTRTPHHFAIVRDFVVLEGLRDSIELAELDRSIEAQERLVKSRQRAFWLPSFALQGSLDERLSESGAGSAQADFFDTTSWSLALAGSYTLYAGGERAANRTQAELDLEQLRLQRSALAQQIEESIRNAAIVTQSALSRARLAVEGAEAAGRNFELVQDSYAQGAIDIIQLLDAQNAALQADTNAADTRYDFFISLMRLQRATSSFDYFVDTTSRDEWLERLIAYFQENGEQPWNGD